MNNKILKYTQKSIIRHPTKFSLICRHYSNMYHLFCIMCHYNNLLNNILSTQRFYMLINRYEHSEFHLKNVRWLDIISDKEQGCRRQVYTDGNRRLNFFRYGHHGQDQFYRWRLFLFHFMCLCMCVCSFFLIFLLSQ